MNVTHPDFEGYPYSVRYKPITTIFFRDYRNIEFSLDLLGFNASATARVISRNDDEMMMMKISFLVEGTLKHRNIEYWKKNAEPVSYSRAH